eukprot:GGOE01056140.1.p1 GENE.GGOE01056140.1~~GGOE01056140.1.p1  ORF type:complete len:267 (+),score=71.91 GGOE01056140.1:194-994(+)
MANIVEQVCHLQGSGREMGIVSSGAVAAGRQLMRNQLAVLRQFELEGPSLPIPSRPVPIMEDQWKHLRYTFMSPECAAVGQSSLVALYDAMFKVYGMGCGQILVSIPDLMYTKPREASCATIEQLLKMKIVPVINENDAITYEPAKGDGSIPIPIADNDAIAAVLAVQLKCDLLLLLSNVPGVFSGDPSQPESKLLPLVTPSMMASGEIKFGSKSTAGRGGMESKVVSALYAVEHGVSVIIGNGLEWRSILDMVEGKPVGTLFSPH